MLDFEDPVDKTVDRAFSAITGINNRHLGLLEVEPFDLARLDASMPELMSWAERVEHVPGLLGCGPALKRMHEFAASGGDLILVDYAQAFPEDEDKNMERTIAGFAWEANALALKYNCAVVVFSQIVREVEQRGYRIYERARFKEPNRVDVSGFAPGGLSDISWAKSLGERAKELGYIWRENRIARKLGAQVQDNKLRIIWGKVNFGEEKDMLFLFDGPTASIREWK